MRTAGSPDSVHEVLTGSRVGYKRLSPCAARQFSEINHPGDEQDGGNRQGEDGHDPVDPGRPDPGEQDPCQQRDQDRGKNRGQEEPDIDPITLSDIGFHEMSLSQRCSTLSRAGKRRGVFLERTGGMPIPSIPSARPGKQRGL